MSVTCDDLVTPTKVTFTNAKFLNIPSFKNSGHDLPPYLQDLTVDFIEYHADIWDRPGENYRTSKEVVYRSYLD